MKKILYLAYVAVLIVMGAATFVESAHGTPYVHQHIYGTWWFALLWAVLATAGAVYIIRCRERRAPVLLLHVSFLVILAGALLTHLTGRSGRIHLRTGERQEIAEMEHCGRTYYHRLGFAVTLTHFQVVEDDGGNVIDYRSEFTIVDDSTAVPLTVSMNSIARHGHIRFYQASYDYDRRGSTLMINRDPYGIPVTYGGYSMLFVSFIWLVVRGCREKRENRLCRDYREFRHYRLLGATLFLTAAWCVYYFVLDGSWSQIPVLRHPLLVFHVVIIIMAYALLLIQTVRPADALLRWALCLLAIGIFLGAVWANISWGNYWTWDSKETWALITLMIYAVPMHKRSLPLLGRPHVYHAYMVFAFLTVLMTYFGVNYFLSGMHSYA